MNERITFVLVTWLDDLHRASLLIRTLRAFVDPAFVAEMIIVVPESDVSYFEGVFSALPWDWRVVSENDVASFPRGMHNYSLQMYLKLAIARYVKTEFYLTLDSDLLLVRPLSERDLIREGKANFIDEPASRHPNWWEDSSRILQYPDYPKEHLFGVTPAVLARTISLRCLERLLSLYGSEFGFLQVPVKEMWTEYTLYRLTGEMEGIFHEFHSVEGFPLLFGEGSLWFPPAETAQFLKDFRTHLMLPDKSLFFVIQGKFGIPPHQIAEVLEPYLAEHAR